MSNFTVIFNFSKVAYLHQVSSNSYNVLNSIILSPMSSNTLIGNVIMVVDLH